MLRIQNLFSRTPPTPTFPVPAITEMLGIHGFLYAGWKSSGSELSDEEIHSFERADCSIHFCFAFHKDYGENSIYLRGPRSEPTSNDGLNLLYAVEYYEALNPLLEAGASRDVALAQVLDKFIEYAARLYCIMMSSGHRVPNSDDRTRAEQETR